MFAREGYALIFFSFFFFAATLMAASWLEGFWATALIGIGLLAFLFTLYFFRDPKRTPPTEPGNLILAPADGKVIEICEVDEPLYLKAHAKRVTIFLSPLNVHVNRIPSTGEIQFVRYVPGDYLVAWHPKASELNERSEIGLMHESGSKVFFKQIAGAVARRVVYHVSEEDHVIAGERFGIVKFGSRMDVIVPLSAEVEVHVGERVKGGLSILGYL